MEKTFEEIIGEVTNENQSTGTQSQIDDNTQNTLGDEYNLQFDDENDGDDSTVTDDADTEDEDDVSFSIPEGGNQQENPSNAAFASMRARNTQLEASMAQLDAIAKSVGLKDANEFLQKAKEQQIAKAAQQKGIPVDVERKLQEYDAKFSQLEQDKVAAIQQQKENILASNLQSFVNDNGLSKTDVDNLSKSLTKDGFTVQGLMDMPKTALNRLLKSYVGDANSMQKSLERKNSIKKELPLNQTSKNSYDINKDIDALARQLAGK